MSSGIYQEVEFASNQALDFKPISSYKELDHSQQKKLSELCAQYEKGSSIESIQKSMQDLYRVRIGAAKLFQMVLLECIISYMSLLNQKSMQMRWTPRRVKN